MRASSFLALASLAVGMTCAGAARAQDTSELQGLLDENVVTTASKSAESATTAPATSTTITAEDLRRFGVHSLDEAIDFLSLGMVTSNPLHQVDIGARGVMLPSDQGDHVLLLVDGHAVNEPLFGIARVERGAGIPMEMVDHIEVILGPGSVLYGSNAMLGVINVVTKRGKDLEGGHVVLETEVLKSYRAAAMVGAQPKLFGKPLELSFGAEYYTQSGPAFDIGPQFGGIDKASGLPTIYTRDKDTPTPPGYYGGRATRSYYSDVPTALLHASWGDFDLEVKGTMYKRATPYRARFINSIIDFNDPDSYELDRSLWVDLKHHARLSEIMELRTRVYADSFDYQDYMNTSEVGGCLFVGVSTCQYHVATTSRWMGAEVQGNFDWTKDGRFVTTLGVDGRLRQIRAKNDTLDYATRQPLASSVDVIHANDGLIGVYLQQTWLPTRWLSLNGGARLDNEDRYSGVVSPRFAAAAHVWQGGELKAVYAEAFRSPSWFETNSANQLTIQADHLRPERVRSVEASIEQRFGAQRIMMGAFRSWWTDLVELHVLTPDEQEQAAREGKIDLLQAYGIIQYRNVSSIDNYGFNLAYDGTLGENGQAHYGVNATGAIARRNDPSVPGSQPLVVAPQAFGNAHVAYDLPGDLPTLAVAGHFMGKRPADRAFDGGWTPPPYAPAQLELRATVSGPIVKGLSYRLSANWALADRGPYVIGPGQNKDVNHPFPELVPVDTFRATVGVQWDFGK